MTVIRELNRSMHGGYYIKLFKAITSDQIQTLQVALMNAFSLPQIAFRWWVEVSLSAPQQTYHLGPFKSQAEAKHSRGAHVNALLHQETRDIIALIKQRKIT